MFHEFGHGLHGLFSKVKYPYMSGTSTPRDFVEFPSQFNENYLMTPQVLKLLADLQARLKLTFVFISHDLAVVEAISDEVAVMCEGRIVEQQGVQELFESPKHSYTRALLATVQSVDSILLERSA